MRWIIDVNIKSLKYLSSQHVYFCNISGNGYGKQPLEIAGELM